MNNRENSEILNTSNMSTKYGLMTGGIMAILLIVFQMTGNDYSPFMKLSKYIILGITITIALNIFKNRNHSNFFANGISMGTKLSMIAGLFLVIINFVIFFLAPSIAFSKYGLEPTSISQVIVISAILFFETLVFGSLITFMVMQYLKGGEVPMK